MGRCVWPGFSGSDPRRSLSILTGTPVAPQPGTGRSLPAFLSPQELGSGLGEGLATGV